MSQSSEPHRSFASTSDQKQAPELLERTRDPARVLALSDGIFAIIMTLLVLDIQVPKLAANETLTTAFLLDVWPKIVVFVISFVLTGLYWVGHRDMFNLVRGVERGLVLLNILYLLPLALVPAAAALLGAYSLENRSSNRDLEGSVTGRVSRSAPGVTSTPPVGRKSRVND